ncbi:MAG TPA: transcriptional repressor [Parafilimonas sp.]|nr:transcriptional repressor [Parafilimonas sp.]
MNEELQEILRKSHLSVTDTRLTILKLFLKNKAALSHADIEKSVGKELDRVTIYRTLQAFLEKGLIHNIPTASNNILYALCKDECYEHQHLDNHAHFVCEDCGQTFCLEDVVIPRIQVPKNFTVKQRDFILNGQCGNCKKK